MTQEPAGPFLFQAADAAAAGNRAEALDSYRTIAERGDARAWAPLGDLLASGPDADPESAADAYLSGAEAGDPIAMYRFAAALEGGRGVAADPVVAMLWYERAADLGLAPAATAAGRLLAAGASSAPDRARRRWEQAVSLGDEPEAMLSLANEARGRGDVAGAVDWAIRAAYATRSLIFEPRVEPYTPVDLTPPREALAGQLEAVIDLVNELREPVFAAAEAGAPDACWHWARILQLGFGEPPDPDEARRWLEAAARHGSPDALHALAGEARQAGDLAGFERRLRAAAERGHGAALHDLAFALHSGAFAEPDPLGACEYYRAAAELGRPVSATDLSFVLEDLDVDGAAAESVRWLRVAADAGHVPAIRRLAERLRDGDGVARDPAEALRWFLAAYYRGWEDGLVELDPLVGELTAEQVLAADRRAGGSGLGAGILLADDPDDDDDLF